jgi:hypothetical protein
MCQDKFPADLQNYIVWRLFSFKPGSVPPKNTLPVFVAPVEEAKTGKKAKKANQAVDQSFKAQIAAAPKDFKGGDAHQFAGEGNLPKDASGKVDMNPAKTVKKVKSKKVINLVPNDIKNPQAA